MRRAMAASQLQHDMVATFYCSYALHSGIVLITVLLISIDYTCSPYLFWRNAITRQLGITNKRLYFNSAICSNN